MREDPGQVISQFLQQLESGSVSSALFKQFLVSLSLLPLDLPLLQGCGNFLGGEKDNLVARKMESRYRRVAFVQQSLEQADWKVMEHMSRVSSRVSKAKPEMCFEDFMFAQTDFSIYDKIDAEDFTLLYIDGLDDLPDDFYTKMFSKEKNEIRKIISARYKPVDGFYISDGNPLLIPIMRSIHTSLDFASFPNQNQFIYEMETLFDFLNKNAYLPEIFFQYLVQEEDDLFCNLLILLDGINVLHDNMIISRFFVAEEKSKTALFAVFNPSGKAYTKLTAVSKIPFNENKKNEHSNRQR